MFSAISLAAFVVASIVIGSEGQTNCYGTIDDLKASGKRNGGVTASRSDVDSRIRELNGLKSCLQGFGRAKCIEPALLAGIASRETQGGALLNSEGYGMFDSDGYGIMQCDPKSGLDCTRYPPRSCDHMKMMSAFLIDKIKEVQGQRRNWTLSQQLQGGVAAYNHFPPSSFSQVDRYTTGGDYSNDVIARAQYLKNQYGF